MSIKGLPTYMAPPRRSENMWSSESTWRWLPSLPSFYQFSASSSVPGLFNKPTDETVMADRTVKLVELLDIYEAQLAEHRYLAGEFVSFADLAHLPFANLYFNVLEQRQLLESGPRVAAWLAKICSRPAWKEIVAIAAPDYASWLERLKSVHASEQ